MARLILMYRFRPYFQRGAARSDDFEEDTMRFHTILVPSLIVGLALTLGCAEEIPVETADPGTVEDPAAEGPGPVTLSEGFSTPESVLYDADEDVYYVSNISGAPLEENGQGYISRITAADRNVEARWIDGTSEEVTLNAPKGMAIVGDELWVTDITTVRRFDRQTGASRGEIRIEGAMFLNDLVSAGGNVAYVSDSGLQAAADGFEPTGSDAVYRIDRDGSVERIAAGENMNRPNGLAVRNSEVWVVTFGANELYRLDDGEKADVQNLPAGSLDGLILLDDGSVLVSSWEAGAVFRGREGSFETVIEDVDSPADIGYDTRRDLVLVPHFMDDQVSIHPLRTD
jgi:sugar lactone lactonase YvrE